MIGRADIEGSKSNVAMNAWLPQASYPCGNFSDTSNFKFRRSKGSLGHAFTVRIRTGNQNQTSFYPSIPHEISVLVELILGHLRYLLTDVPPQPNSPPDNVFCPDRPAEASLGSKKRGNAPPPIHGIIGLVSSSTGSSFPADSAKPVPLAVVSLDSRQGQWESLGFPLFVPVLSRLFDARGRGPEGPIPNPSPDRHATTRSRHESSSSSPLTADGFGAGTPVPSPQSQSFSRGYGSILPTSLAYIVPSTRGCSPWRPDAVMSTTGRDRHSVHRIFKGRRGCTGHHATCDALPAAGPYLPLSRFQGGQAFSFEYLLLPPRSAPTAAPPGLAPQLDTVTRLPVHPASPVLLTKNGPLGVLDSVARLNRAAAPSYLFKYRCGPPPEFPLALPRSGIVHHLLGPDRHALTRTLHRRSGSVGGATPGGIPPISFLAPCGFIHPLTRTHVRLLGPCFKTGRMGSQQADARSAQVPKHASGRALPSTIAMMTYPRAYRRPGLGPPSQSASVDAPSRLADQRRRSTSDRGASPAPIRFPPDNFKHSLTLFSKSFSSFPCSTCSLSVSRQYLALDGIYRPIRAAFPNNPTRRQCLVVRQGPGTTGLSPSLAPPSRGLGPGPPLRTLLQTTIQTPGATDSHARLFPRVAPPDLRSRSGRSTSPAGRRALNRGRGARDWPRGLFSTTICRGAAPHQEPVSLNQPRARGSREANIRPLPVPSDGRDGGRLLVTPRQACPQPKGFECNLHSKTQWFMGFCNSHQVSHFATFFIDARAEISGAGRARPDLPRLGCLWTRSRVNPGLCGIDNDPSSGSPTEILLRLLLPLNDKVQWTSHNVAGSEPPTSPRSEHFTEPFNRLPGPVGQGYRLVEYISVARVWPRTSKGITYLLLPQTSVAWAAIVPLRSWPWRVTST
ncbi:hypothetical protein HN873_060258 [Arachis hypogaea]